MSTCGHALCELIGGACSLATGRSRGCRPNVTERTTAPAILDEVRALLPAIERGDREAAVRLATIMRREALDDRPLLAHVRSDEPELAPALERLCVRRR